VGLSAFQARAHPALIWAAFALPALGGAVSLVGMIGMSVVGHATFIAGQSPWAIWAVGTVGLVVGSALFALATWRTRALSRAGAGRPLLGSLASIPMLRHGGALAGGLADDHPDVRGRRGRRNPAVLGRGGPRDHGRPVRHGLGLARS